MIHWPTVLITIAVLGSLAASLGMLWLGLRLARHRDEQELFEHVEADKVK